MKSILIDLQKQPNLPFEFIQYARLNGWARAYHAGFLIASQCYIIVGGQPQQGEELRLWETAIYYCRADMPWGQGNKFPRSRDILAKDIPSFYSECRAISEDAIVLCFLHPSIMLTGGYLPRFSTTGAVVAEFECGKRLLLEYVGAGFDSGDITRGKAVHFGWEIPWQLLLDDSPLKIMQYMQSGGLCYFCIGQNGYNTLRESRISELNLAYSQLPIGVGISEKAIRNAVPKTPQPMDIGTFQILYETCLKKAAHSVFAEHHDCFALFLNFYAGMPYVYEVWTPQRNYI